MGETRSPQNSFLGSLMGRYFFYGLSVDERIILTQFNATEFLGVDCIYRAQDKNQWGDVVNTVMNLRVL